MLNVCSDTPRTIMDLLNSIPVRIFQSSTKYTLTPKDIYLFWNKLDETRISKVVQLGLKFMLCTLTRGIEVRTMEWSEIDYAEGVWIIPNSKAKNGRQQLVPLNKRALSILDEIRRLTGQHRFVFGWNKLLNIDETTKVSSNNAMKETAFSHALRDNLYVFDMENKFTPHDLRRTGATLLTSVGYSREWVSMLLNHKPKGVTAQVYDTFDYFEEKRAGMECIQYILDRITSAKTTDFVPSIKTLRSEFMAKGLVFEFLKEEYYSKPVTECKPDFQSMLSSPVSYTLSYDPVKL
ncbi:site-specific integrase [Roseivirga pacifica]